MVVSASNIQKMKDAKILLDVKTFDMNYKAPTNIQ